MERPSAPAPRNADEPPVAQGIAHEDLPADLPPFEETEPVSLAETVEPGFEPDAVPELDFEPEEESPPPPLTAGVPESERASPPPRTHGRQPGVVGAMEQVREIIESLTETLDQMERVLEMLEDAEREKLTDEREIASLRRLLDNVQRSHPSGPRAPAQGPPRGPPRPSRGGRR